MVTWGKAEIGMMSDFSAQSERGGMIIQPVRCGLEHRVLHSGPAQALMPGAFLTSDFSCVSSPPP